MHSYMLQAVCSALGSGRRLLSMLFMVLMLAMGGMLKAQSITVDKQGNYHAIKDTFKAFQKSPVVATGNTYTDTKGIKYDLYKTSSGRLFYYRTSKNTGKQYKVYLKIDNKEDNKEPGIMART